MKNKILIFFFLFSAFFLNAQHSFFRGTNNYVAPVVVTQAPPVITGGLVLNLDAASTTSYSGTGTTWSDISGANNHATLAGNPAFTAASPSYFTFNGGNNANVNFAWTTDFTCSFWIYPISAPGGGYSRIVSTAPGDNFEIAINSSNQLSYYSPTVGWQSNFTTITSAAWSQVVFVKVAGNLSIYVNNILIRATTIGVSPGTKIYLGQRYQSNEGSNVRIGSFLLYNYGLSASNVSSNWMSQKARFGY